MISAVNSEPMVQIGYIFLNEEEKLNQKNNVLMFYTVGSVNKHNKKNWKLNLIIFH